MPEVSIIVPVYNAARYLEECLDSVLAQTLQDIEIICINDGSTDNSRNILEQYARNDPRLKIVDQENLGVSAARNAGIDLALGKFLLFLDSDDLLDNKFNFKLIERQVSDLLLFDFTYLYENNSLLLIHNEFIDYIHAGKERLLIDFVTWKLKIRIGSFLIKKAMINEYRLKFNEGQSYAEDVEFIIKALYHSDKLDIFPINLNFYRDNSESAIAKVNYNRFESFASRKRLWEFFKVNSQFNDLLQVYEGYLLPEAIIYIIELMYRKGFNYFKLEKFLNNNNLRAFLDESRFNKFTPEKQREMIVKYNRNSLSYFVEMRCTEIIYLSKVFVKKNLRLC